MWLPTSSLAEALSSAAWQASPDIRAIGWRTNRAVCRDLTQEISRRYSDGACRSQKQELKAYKRNRGKTGGG
ncbi:hypothetical protein, partial [Mesorhizobium silamurunense]